MRLVFAREAAAAVLEEAIPLMRAHWAEVAYDDRPYDPYLAGYLALDQMGAMRLFTARAEGALMGYVCMVVSPCMNHQTELHAHENGTYLKPEARLGRNATALMDYAKAALVAEGVREIHYRVPTRHPRLGKILARRGYTHDDDDFVWRL